MLMVSERTTRTVSFICDGSRLYGTLRRPQAASESKETGVVVLNQGPLDRSGAHQLSVRVAKRLNALGLPTLQFDARGVGESEGDWITPTEGEPIQALYKRIFEGAWKADTEAAIRFLQSETGVRRVLLIGLCGGASTALHTGAAHPAVDGMVMVGMPIRLQFDTANLDAVVDSFIRSETNRYFEKALAPEAWKRFFTFQTDYRAFTGLVTRRVKDLLPFKKRAPLTVSQDILRSFHTAVKARKRLLFVYSENDYLWTEFKELFLPFFPQRESHFDLTTIPEANHTLTETVWQEQLYRTLIEWVLVQTHDKRRRPWTTPSKEASLARKSAVI
jgi:uncharacterized protein